MHEFFSENLRTDSNDESACDIDDEALLPQVAAAGIRQHDGAQRTLSNLLAVGGPDGKLAIGMIVAVFSSEDCFWLAKVSTPPYLVSERFFDENSSEFF
jgi:hypothetical protein